MALILALIRRIPEARDNQHKRVVRYNRRPGAARGRIQRKTLIVVGLG
jgi:phosphoglycerate dehydrogenase-like enzyme